MNKILMRGGIIVIILVAGVGVWLFMNLSISDRSQENLVNTFQESGKTSGNSTPASLTELLKRGISQQCMFTSREKDILQTVLVYTGNRKLRIDLTTQMGENTLTVHTIMDSALVHTWETGSGSLVEPLSPIGIISPVSKGVTSHKLESNEISLTKELDYQCKPWNVDESQFILPSNIRFVDEDKIQPGMIPNR